MKLLRYGPAGKELPGMLDAHGTLRALSPIVKDIDATVLSPEGLRFLAALDATKLPAVVGTPRLGAPLGAIREIVAIGLNYRDHAIESNLPIPAEPVVFSKSTSSVSGPNDDILLPFARYARMSPSCMRSVVTHMEMPTSGAAWELPWMARVPRAK